MEATATFSSSYPCLPVSQNVRNRQRKPFSHIASATSRDNSYGRLVDESMIVLRRRLHEMKVVERNYEPPMEWMEWERQIYASYSDFVCRFVGLLQSHLMSTPPSVALGMLALVAVSVPVSSFAIFMRLIEVAGEATHFNHLS